MNSQSVKGRYARVLPIAGPTSGVQGNRALPRGHMLGTILPMPSLDIHEIFY